MLNNLRSRIAVETDGQLKTGRDVVIAALLGAEEFGFATAPLVALGCIMMRVCHLNTCPVGVATQDPELRKKFTGKPEHVVNFMRFIAQEVREIMAQLGFRTIDEMIGRTDRLEAEARRSIIGKRKGLDFSQHSVSARSAARMSAASARSRRITASRSRSTTPSCSICANPRSSTAKRSSAELPIRNVQPRGRHDRRQRDHAASYGAKGLPDDTIQLHFNGSAGQSFGAFMPQGMTLSLEGDANDYVGKGLSGGKIIVYPAGEADLRRRREHHHRQRRALRRDRAAKPTSAAWPANASASATPASTPSSKPSATTAANT